MFQYPCLDALVRDLKAQEVFGRLAMFTPDPDCGKRSERFDSVPDRLWTVCDAAGGRTAAVLISVCAAAALRTDRTTPDVLALSIDAGIELLAGPQGGAADPGVAGVPQAKRPSCTVDEANAAAMKLAKADPQFVNGSVRKWAAAVRKATGTTCSTATVKLTRLWIRTMEISGRGRTKGKTPKAVALTGKVESVIGKGDKHQVLKDLIAEQTADDDDRPGTRRKPKQYKRV